MWDELKIEGLRFSLSSKNICSKSIGLKQRMKKSFELYWVISRFKATIDKIMVKVFFVYKNWLI